MALTFSEVILIALPESTAVALCCLALLRLPWNIRPLSVVVILETLAAWGIRALGPPFGVHTIVLTVFLGVLLVLVYRVNIRQGLTAAALTILLLAFFETVFAETVMLALGLTPGDLRITPTLRILLGLPNAVLLLLTAVLIKKREEGPWRRYLGL